MALVLGGSFTLLTMLYGAGWKFEWSEFYPWALSPYAVYFLVTRLATRSSSSIAGAGCVGAALMLGFTVFAYGDAMFIHVSSTSVLIFIFAPLYMLVGGPLVFGIAVGVSRLMRSRNTNDS